MRLNAVQKQGVIWSIRDKWMPAYKNGADGNLLECCGGCFLCAMFHWEKTDSGMIVHCRKCPIQIKTGLNGCRNTPYDNIDENTTYPPKDPDVKAELLYLISFLPIKERAVFYKEMEKA